MKTRFYTVLLAVLSLSLFTATTTLAQSDPDEVPILPQVTAPKLPVETPPVVPNAPGGANPSLIEQARQDFRSCTCSSHAAHTADVSRKKTYWRNRASGNRSMRADLYKKFLKQLDAAAEAELKQFKRDVAVIARNAVSHELKTEGFKRKLGTAIDKMLPGKMDEEFKKRGLAPDGVTPLSAVSASSSAPSTKTKHQNVSGEKKMDMNIAWIIAAAIIVGALLIALLSKGNNKRPSYDGAHFGQVHLPSAEARITPIAETLSLTVEKMSEIQEMSGRFKANQRADGGWNARYDPTPGREVGSGSPGGIHISPTFNVNSGPAPAAVTTPKKAS